MRRTSSSVMSNYCDDALQCSCAFLLNVAAIRVRVKAIFSPNCAKNVFDLLFTLMPSADASEYARKVAQTHNNIGENTRICGIRAKYVRQSAAFCRFFVSVRYHNKYFLLMMMFFS